MVIQRWQTLFLLIAVVLMGVFCSTPYAVQASIDGAVPATEVFMKDTPVLLVLNLVLAALLFISIFMFKNLRMQMRVTMMSIVLLCASIVTCGIVVYVGMANASLIWTGGVVLLVIALVCAICALRLMKKDHRILSSADRLW